MKLMILGSGQDDGIPHTACYCDVCTRAREDPKHRRLGPSLAVFDEGNGACYLVDASPDLKYQLDMLKAVRGGTRGTHRVPVDGIFLTHAHMGHCLGLLHLGKEAVDEREIQVYCTPEMDEFLSGNHPFSLLVERRNILISTLIPHHELEFPGVRFTPLPVPHRNEVADTVGYVIESEKRALYIPDVDRWTDELLTEIAQADMAFIDGTFYSPDELPRMDEVPHPPILETMELLENVQAQVHFTHINHTNPVNRGGASRARVEERGFGIAYDGLIVDI